MIWETASSTFLFFVGVVGYCVQYSVYPFEQTQAGIEDDDEVGETSPLNVRSADGGKFMEEFFDQVKTDNL